MKRDGGYDVSWSDPSSHQSSDVVAAVGCYLAYFEKLPLTQFSAREGLSAGSYRPSSQIRFSSTPRLASPGHSSLQDVVWSFQIQHHDRLEVLLDTSSSHISLLRRCIL